MIKRIFTIALLALIALAFFPLVTEIQEQSGIGPLGEAYLEKAAQDLGAANLVTSVVVTYRGLDTLGEVTVLFAAAAGVALVFGSASESRKKKPDSSPAATQGPSEILRTGTALLLPLILLFGVYIFVHGHLTPGGGFQGGVVIASAVLLALLSGTLQELSHRMLALLEIAAGAGYVAVGLLGFWLAAGFLDPRVLPAGEFGQLFSAGAIPVIYILIGIKVGAELSGVIAAMRQPLPSGIEERSIKG